MERQTMNHHRGDERHHGRVMRRVSLVHSHHPHRTRLRVVRAAVIVVMGAFLAGCPSSKTTKFREEVQLSTGEVITVFRETHHRPGGGEILRSSGWRPAAYFIRFRYPPNSKELIEYQTAKWEPTRWGMESQSNPEFPLVLDYDQSRQMFYLISRHFLKGACFEYVRYFYRNGTWVEDRLPDEFEPIVSNLYIGAARVHPPSRVKLDFKRRENASTRYSLVLRQVGPKQFDCKA